MCHYFNVKHPLQFLFLHIDIHGGQGASTPPLVTISRDDDLYLDQLITVPTWEKEQIRPKDEATNGDGVLKRV